jgi:hypothetical protein
VHPKLLPLSGLAFVALTLVTVVGIGSTPGTTDSAEEITSFYEGQETRQFIGSFAFAATVPFLVIFAVVLGRSFGRPDREGSIWSQVTSAGAVLAGGAILVTAAIHFALLDASNQEGARQAAPALVALDGSTWVAYNAGLGVMMIGAAGVVLSSAAGRRWVGWIALALGVALFIPFVDFAALLGTLVWIGIASITLARGATRAALAPAPGAA